MQQSSSSRPAGASSSPASLFWLKYALSATAAGVAETVTFPFDITKTRLQAQGERAAGSGTSSAMPSGHAGAARRGAVSTLIGIVREEGALRLWAGLCPAVLRHVVYSGVRMAAYERLRAQYRSAFQPESARLPLHASALCGMISGAVGQFLASPTDLIKVQMQLDGRRVLRGERPLYDGTVDAFRQLYRQAGMAGMWRGWLPNVQRAALVNLGELTTYDTAKQLVLAHTTIGDNSLTHALSSICSGLVAAIVGTPADVIKTRIMNQPVQDGRGVLYSGMIDCARKTVSNEGVWALYKGFVPIWARMAPWSLTFWLSFEQLRRLAGAPSF